MKRYISKVLVGVYLLTSILLITGCSEISIEGCDIATVFARRGEANLSIAKMLHDSGILNDIEYKGITDSINATMTMFPESTGGELNISELTQVSLAKAISGWRNIEWVEVEKVDGVGVNEYGVTQARWEGGLDTNDGKKTSGYIPLLLTEYPGKFLKFIGLGNGSRVEPIKFIDEDTAYNINEKFGYEVWVLHPFEKLSETVTGGSVLNDQMSIDEVIAVVDAAISTDGEVDKLLENYFTPARNSEDDKITLYDMTKVENKLIKASYNGDESYVNTGNMPLGQEKDENNINKIVDLGDAVYTESADSLNDSLTSATRQIARPGNDLVISQWGCPIFSVRFVEFDQQAVENLISNIGLNSSQYIISNNTKRVYLMEYPVYVMEAVKESDEDINKFESTFMKSLLNINIKTGRMSKNKEAWTGIPTAESVYFDTTNSYYNIGGAVNHLEKSKSSFIIYGSTEGMDDKDQIVLGEKKEVVYRLPRIVLRDYMEATYAPGIVQSEPLILLGRKLRVMNFEGNKSMKFATYYNINGEPLEERDDGKTRDIYVQDIADTYDLFAGAQVSYIPPLNDLKSENGKLAMDRVIKGRSNNSEEGQAGGNGASSTDEPISYGYNREIGMTMLRNTSVRNMDGSIIRLSLGGSTPEGGQQEQGIYDDVTGDTQEDNDSGNSIRESVEAIKNIQSTKVGEINPIYYFPSDKIGTVDNHESETPLLYTIAVKKSMFETALFSGWIQQTSTQENSLVWWNDNWLVNKNYSYRINKLLLEDYLVGNYTFELNKEGIIILDLATIAKIQKEFDLKSAEQAGRQFRTAFTVLGWALILYAFLLLLAWVIDTSVDFGFKILNKITFGKMIAIRDKSGIETGESYDYQYATFKDTSIKATIIAIIGMVLLLLDMVEIILGIMRVMSGVSDAITSIISGK